VLLEVTVGLDANPDTDVAPEDVVAALQAAGQPVSHGWSRRGDDPWRLRFQLTGRDRVTVGQALEAELCVLGYDPEVFVWP
jgi:hypothetical protein